jgi:hypothetical protein
MKELAWAVAPPSLCRNTWHYHFPPWCTGLRCRILHSDIFYLVDWPPVITSCVLSIERNTLFLQTHGLAAALYSAFATFGDNKLRATLGARVPFADLIGHKSTAFFE